MKDPTWDAENPFSFDDYASRQALGEQIRGPERLDMAYMTHREEEEFLLHYGPRKERKAIKKRREAEKSAEKEAKKRLSE